MAEKNRPTAAQLSAKKDIQWKWWAFGVAVLLLLIIVLQNSQDVAFKVLFIFDTSAPLVVLLLIAALIGAVIGYTAPILRRHRHRTRQEYGKE